ncbi:MAG: response regulator [Clostridia bacterium]|nr:response regulator [Clostridia bacterium]
MSKLLIVDDEQIVLDSVLFIVEKYMTGSLETQTARSGREAIEKAAVFRPDIVLMDICMPGISGLDAIADIKRIHPGALFIVVTAYAKFDFAKEALQLGAIDYLNKPISRTKLIAAFENAIRIKENEHKSLEFELELKEKMAFILPALESGFIYSMLFSDDHTVEMISFRKILDISSEGGYIMTVEFGETHGKDGIANKIGTSIKGQKLYPAFREVIKECCTGIVGPLMLNRILVFVPCAAGADEYRQRIGAMEVASEIYSKLRALNENIDFVIGIGRYYPDLGSVYRSFEESVRAIGYAKAGGLYHINDAPLENGARQGYPENKEKLLLKSVTLNEPDVCLMAFDHIFEWLTEHTKGNLQEIASGLTELTVMLSRTAKEYGVIGETGNDYLNDFFAIRDLSTLRVWSKNRIRQLCADIAGARDKRLSCVIVDAKEYIEQNFCSEITLEDVSRAVNISPSYFSKLFKDETGSNFIDYLTALRIEKAKKLLDDRNCANKEICYQIGYSDPNYFSRIFKKIVGVTPTEYKSSALDKNL